VATTDPVARDGFVLPAGLDLQGHRGARGLKPENTLPAFETALDLMVTTLEFDLHLSGDDEIIVWHDPVIDPSKCGLRAGAPPDIPDPDDPDTPEAALAVRALSVDQLSWYECNRNPDQSRFTTQDSEPTSLAGSVYSIVTLDQLIDFVDRYVADTSKTQEQRDGAATVQFNMETKRKKDPGAIGDDFDGESVGLFETLILGIIGDRGIGERTTIQSFSVQSLRAIRMENPILPLAFLDSRRPYELAELAAWGISIWSPNFEFANEQLVAEAHDLGLEVKVWTIESTDPVSGLLDAGVDGLITDRPDLFIVGG
jgi:glycerophosphoryl diester phosphodiesterase